MPNDSASPASSDFSLVYVTLRATEWAIHPQVSGYHTGGTLPKGELVRLATPPPGSGPRWHPAELTNGTRCFVRVDDVTAADS